MTVTLRGERCKVRQFWDIISIVEKILCRIFEGRYVVVRSNFLHETKIYVILHLIRRIVHIHWQNQGKDKLYVGISEFVWVNLLKGNNINATPQNSPNLKHIICFVSLWHTVIGQMYLVTMYLPLR